MKKSKLNFLKYIALFIALYFISALTIKLSLLIGIEYNNPYTVVFNSALFSTFFLVLVDRLIKRINKKSHK